MKQLKWAVSNLNDTFNTLLYLRTLRIKFADATTPQSFSGSSCIVESPSHANQTYFTAGSVFVGGVAVLEGYLKDDCQVPVNKHITKALKKLLHFLSSSHSELTSASNGTDDGECYWTMVLAEHLLIVVDSNFTIDHQYTKPSSMSMSTGDHHKMKEKFGDTTFGCCDGWHGSVDIMMGGNILPVSVVTKGDESDDSSSASESVTEDDESDDSSSAEDGKHVGSSGASKSSVEANAKEFTKKDLSQKMAQTIVLSFLKKRQNNTLTKSLVPSVGISKDSLVVFFYDCDNDILLHSTKLPLFETDALVRRRVGFLPAVFLWLALNYKYFCSGIVKEMRNGKANFFSIVGPFLEKYKTEVNAV